MEVSEFAIAVAIAFLFGVVGQLWLCLIASIPLWRLPGSAHWTERARRAWSFRQVIGWGPFVLGIVGIACGIGDHVPSWTFFFLYAAAMVGGIISGVGGMRWFLRRPYTLGDRLGDYVFTFLVRAPATPTLIVMAVLLDGRVIDWGSVLIMAGGLGLALAGTLGAFMPLIRAAGVLRPGDERLQRVSARAAAEAGIAPPPVYALRWAWANAIAFTHAHAIAFTDTMVALLNDDELVAVAVHEIAHLTESPAQKRMRLSGLLAIFPIFTIPLWIAPYGIVGVLVPVGIFFFGQRFLVRFARRMEERADAAAHAHSAESIMATALEKAYEYNVVPAVMQGKRQIHPHLYDRMVAAGLQPAYPRPKAPGSGFAGLAIASVLFLIPAAAVFHPLKVHGPKSKVQSHGSSLRQFGE